MSTAEIRTDIEPMVVEWERLAQHTKANPFLWPGWIRAWWRAFGTGQLQIITTRENGQLTGVLPLRQSHGTLSSPTNYHTPWFGFLAANERAVEQLSRGLLSQRPRRVCLSFLPSTDIGVSSVCTVAGAARYRMLTESKRVAPYVDSDQSWEAYESGLRRQFRSDLRRRRRRLEEKGQVTLEVSHGTQKLSELLEEGFRIEGSGWKEAQGTSINSHPATRQFYTEVAHWASERGWLRLAFLRLDGRALAFDYCLEHNGIHYMLKTGYDPAYQGFSPGRIIRYLMIHRAFSSQISTYDLLGPDYEWKREWATDQQEALILHVFAPTLLGSIDRAAFVHGRPAAKRAKNLASSILGERGNRLLKFGEAMVRARVGQ